MTVEQATILIVDDEAVVRRVLGDALIQAGHRVRLAASADAAMAVLHEAPADLMLLDLQLGDEDGVTVMRAARARWPSLPIIILTAHGSMGSAIEAVRHEAADYLLKPIGLDALRARVAEVLDRHRAKQDRHERIRHMYHQLQALVVDEGLMPEPAAEAPPGPVLRVGPLILDVQQHLVRMAGQTIELTPSEFAILHALVRQPSVVVPCVQLIRAFQSAQMDEDEARMVMRPHIVRLRRKIEPDPQHPCYIQSVRGVGYRWNSIGDGMGDDA